MTYAAYLSAMYSPRGTWWSQHSRDWSSPWSAGRGWPGAARCSCWSHQKRGRQGWQTLQLHTKCLTFCVHKNKKWNIYLRHPEPAVVSHFFMLKPERSRCFVLDFPVIRDHVVLVVLLLHHLTSSYSQSLTLVVEPWLSMRLFSDLIHKQPETFQHRRI